MSTLHVVYSVYMSTLYVYSTWQSTGKGSAVRRPAAVSSPSISPSSPRRSSSPSARWTRSYPATTAAPRPGRRRRSWCPGSSPPTSSSSTRRRPGPSWAGGPPAAPYTLCLVTPRWDVASPVKLYWWEKMASEYFRKITSPVYTGLVRDN